MELKNETILIIEDDTALSDLLTERVNALGYQVTCAFSGQAALEWLENTTPFLMILDYSLPDMNSKEFINELLKVNKQIPPFIVSTGRGDERVAVEMMRLGAKDYLIKDMNFWDMLPLILNRVTREIENEQSRHQAEAALAISESGYRRLFETSKDGILILDAETGMIMDVNPFMIEMLGYSKNQFLEKYVWDIGFFKDIIANKAMFLELQQKEYVRYTALPLETVTGTAIYVEFISNLYIANNKPLIQCNIRDISEQNRTSEALKEAKERAEESDRLKSAFLANMSHEIRTPMNGILGFADLLKNQQLSGADQQLFIEIIEKSGLRMLNIINDLINISKIESGLMEVFVSESNINEQIDYIFTFFKSEVERKGIKLIMKKRLPSELSMVKTDREKLYAILTNLVKNAIKFTEVGTIEFGCEKKGSNIEFFVKDSGIGVDESQQCIIFERFRQGNETTTKNYEGAGLGLSISKAFVEMQGGKMWLESKKGEGSTFYFTLPYVPIQAEPLSIVEDEHVHIEEYKLKKLRILIAEDDELSDRLLSVVLKDLSKEILHAKNGKDAVEICRTNSDLDLILMDVKMPEMNGLVATSEIRKFNKEVVIIAQTAFALVGDRELAIAAGCTDYLPKPIIRVDLLNLLQQYYSV